MLCFQIWLCWRYLGILLFGNCFGYFFQNLGKFFPQSSGHPGLVPAHFLWISCQWMLQLQVSFFMNQKWECPKLNLCLGVWHFVAQLHWQSFFAKMSATLHRDSNPLLALATSDNATQIEMILHVLRYPSWSRWVAGQNRSAESQTFLIKKLFECK